MTPNTGRTVSEVVCGFLILSAFVAFAFVAFHFGNELRGVPRILCDLIGGLCVLVFAALVAFIALDKFLDHDDAEHQTHQSNERREKHQQGS